MIYIVIELQTTNGKTSSLTYQFDNINLADQKYYQILSAAAVSSVDIHAALIMDPTGFVLKNASYNHKTETDN